MSYNISALKIGTIDLAFPMDFDFQKWLTTQPDTPGKNWCLQHENEVQINLAKKTWELSLASQTLYGIIKDNKLDVKSMELSDDGSGTIYGTIIVPLFEEFKGNLRAIVVWEGGDSIYHVTINQGKYSEEKIEP